MRTRHIEVKVYGPITPTGKAELAKRISTIHAEYVLRKIDSLPGPRSQKRALLDAVISDVKQRQQESPVPKSKTPDRGR